MDARQMKVNVNKYEMLRMWHNNLNSPNMTCDTDISSNTNCKDLGIYVSHYVGVIIVEENCRSPLPVKRLHFKSFISVLMSDQWFNVIV